MASMQKRTPGACMCGPNVVIRVCSSTVMKNSNAWSASIGRRSTSGVPNPRLPSFFVGAYPTGWNLNATLR